MTCDDCKKKTGIQYKTEFGFLCDKCWDKLIKYESILKKETSYKRKHEK